MFVVFVSYVLRRWNILYEEDFISFNLPDLNFFKLSHYRHIQKTYSVLYVQYADAKVATLCFFFVFNTEVLFFTIVCFFDFLVFMIIYTFMHKDIHSYALYVYKVETWKMPSFVICHVLRYHSLYYYNKMSKSCTMSTQRIRVFTNILHKQYDFDYTKKKQPTTKKIL